MIEFGSKEYLEAVEKMEVCRREQQMHLADMKLLIDTFFVAHERTKALEDTSKVSKYMSEAISLEHKVKDLEALLEAKDEALRLIGTYRKGQVLLCGDERLYLVGEAARNAHDLTPEALKQKIAARDAVIDALDRHCEQLEREGCADWDEIHQARDRLKRVTQG
jgi:hypothetical protein